MGALYLASRLEECTLRLRGLIKVYHLLLQRHKHELLHPKSEYKCTATSYWSQVYYNLKGAIVVAEMQILECLGFNVQVILPYGTLVNYLQVLGLIERTEAFFIFIFIFLKSGFIVLTMRHVTLQLNTI